MFSGIIESTARVLETRERDGVLELTLERPPAFADVALGDSIAVDGVCLTVERFDSASLQFALGTETLRVTGWSATRLKSRVRNLERSIRMGDRIHGHLVTGHVDAQTTIAAAERHGENLRLVIRIPASLRPYVWSKGSVAVNGVSLTVNQVVADSETDTFAVGLIPETLKRTNLGALETGDLVNLEVDNMARGLVRQAELR